MKKPKGEERGRNLAGVVAKKEMDLIWAEEGEAGGAKAEGSSSDEAPTEILNSSLLPIELPIPSSDSAPPHPTIKDDMRALLSRLENVDFEAADFALEESTSSRQFDAIFWSVSTPPPPSPPPRPLLPPSSPQHVRHQVVPRQSR